MSSCVVPRGHVLLSLFAAAVLSACGGAAEDPASTMPSERAEKGTTSQTPGLAK